MPRKVANCPRTVAVANGLTRTKTECQCCRQRNSCVAPDIKNSISEVSLTWGLYLGNCFRTYTDIGVNLWGGMTPPPSVFIPKNSFLDTELERVNKIKLGRQCGKGGVRILVTGSNNFTLFQRLLLKLKFPKPMVAFAPPPPKY